MGDTTKIEWADATFNPWIGCTKVSPGCDNCYAEDMAKRFWPNHWGPGATPMRSSPDTWRRPIAWNAKARTAGKRPRVFCASLADVFDNQVPTQWRKDLFMLIADTPSLDWLLLTKRPQNFAKMLPWSFVPWPNVWLGVSAENQEEADRRIPILLQTPAAKRFISAEPLLGPINLLGPTSNSIPGLDWVIVGGESGRKARIMDSSWACDLRDQCDFAEIPFFMKQMCHKEPIPDELMIREFPT